jgi:hypothetical protein
LTEALPAPTGAAAGDLCALPKIPAGIKKPAAAESKRFVAYYSSYHGIQEQQPDAAQLKGVTHLVLGMCKL